MPRTTLSIDDDALKIAKAHASRRGMTPGEAVSELLRQAAGRSLVTDTRNGLVTVRLRRGSPRVTAALVDRLRNQLP
jgi:hypothetical protein